MNSPEAPFIAGGALVCIAAVARTGSIPKNVLPAIMGTVALAIVASVTTNSRVGRVVSAVGYLYMLAAGSAAVVAINDAASKRNKDKKRN